MQKACPKSLGEEEGQSSQSDRLTHLCHSVPCSILFQKGRRDGGEKRGSIEGPACWHIPPWNGMIDMHSYGSMIYAFFHISNGVSHFRKHGTTKGTNVLLSLAFLVPTNERVMGHQWKRNQMGKSGFYITRKRKRALLGNQTKAIMMG